MMWTESPYCLRMESGDCTILCIPGWTWAGVCGGLGGKIDGGGDGGRSWAYNRFEHAMRKRNRKYLMERIVSITLPDFIREFMKSAAKV